MSIVKPLFIYPMPYEFQVIQSVKTKSIYGYEALLRPEDGMDPRMYVNYRIAYGGTHQLELDTFFNATRMFKELRMPGYLFVNSLPNETMDIHESKLYENEFGQDTISRVVVEILEYPYVNKDAWYTKQRFLMRHDMQTALDHFGSGLNASPDCVMFYHPDIVKLPYELIHDFTEDAQRVEYIKALVGNFKEHDVTVLACGVENVVEYEMLKEFGIDLAQGFYVGMPGIPEPPPFIEDGDTTTKF